MLEENEELKGAIKSFLSQHISEPKETPSINISWQKFALAASIILVCFSFLWAFYYKDNSKSPLASKVITKATSDILPGRTGAVLSLSNGENLLLEGNQGSLGIQGNSLIENKKGKLTYLDNRSDMPVVFNTLSTPIGRQYVLELSDGSKVWLNSGSSITFPTSFKSGIREVSITGEVFFEVAHDTSKPFHVNAKGVDIRVFGTHFNVNSYDNEPYIKTTLIEGSVKVSQGKDNVMILPGEQAVVSHDSGSRVVKNRVNIESVIGWKRGKFVFQDEDIKGVMRQIERWYGVTAVYAENVPQEEFVGVISRDVNLSQILAMLEKTGKIDFKIEGRRVMVK